MDEMKIKSGLIFSKRTGSLVGFVDLGSANRDMKQLIADNTADSTKGLLADQVFVFMARAVFKPSLAVPIGHYPSLNLSGKWIIPYYMIMLAHPGVNVGVGLWEEFLGHTILQVNIFPSPVQVKRSFL